jgi:hypothetical protein
VPALSDKKGAAVAMRWEDGKIAPKRPPFSARHYGPGSWTIAIKWEDDCLCLSANSATNMPRLGTCADAPRVATCDEKFIILKVKLVQ